MCVRSKGEPMGYIHLRHALPPPKMPEFFPKQA
jgi:hypothetical protein